MELSPVERMQLNKQVERVLHVPGNYTGGILEMALVLDYDMPLEVLQEKSAGILRTLKMHSEVFKNVRLNVIKWVSDECLVKEVSAISMVQMGRIFEDYSILKDKNTAANPETEVSSLKTLDELTRQLKLFYARSKLILVLTEGNYRTADEAAVRQFMQPFLHRKILFLQPEGIIPGTRLLLQSDS